MLLEAGRLAGFRCRIFSSDILSGTTSTTRYPLARATSASPRRVLPAVASTTVPHDFRRPFAFRGVDHCQPDPILDRAAGILRFELQERGGTVPYRTA